MIMNATSLLRGFALLALLQWLSTLVVGWLGVPFPPALLGMLLLLLLLLLKIVPVSEVEDICDLLISKMSLLFLPAGVSVLLYFDVIKAEFSAIVLSVVICSALVLLLPALALQALLDGRKKEGR